MKKENYVLKLEDVEIYTNGNEEYQLTYCQTTGFLYQVTQSVVSKQASLYAFSTQKEANLFLHTIERFGDSSMFYRSVRKSLEDSSVFILVVQRDSDSGIIDHQDWRSIT